MRKRSSSVLLSLIRCLYLSRRRTGSGRGSTFQPFSLLLGLSLSSILAARFTRLASFFSSILAARLAVFLASFKADYFAALRSFFVNEACTNTPLGPSPVVIDIAKESPEDFAFEALASSGCAIKISAPFGGIESATGG
jgi:hypothetical protein